MAKKNKKKAAQWEPTPLSRLIVRRITDLGITQALLAKRLNFHPSYISQLAKGRPPDFDAPGFVERFAAALELDPDVFLADAELHRLNPFPVDAGELRPVQRMLVAVTKHLDDETLYGVIRGVRAQFGEPPGEPPPALESAEMTQTIEPSD